MRYNRFISAAFAATASPAVEEHAPDAGDATPNEIANTAAVQGVIEPVVAADGSGDVTLSSGKPEGAGEATVDVPEVDSVAELQETVGALEDEVMANDQDFVQGVSDEFTQELEGAVDVVASLEHLSASINYAIESGECNRSTNAAFYHAMTEAAKRSGFYTQEALESGETLQLTHDEAAGAKGAASIGSKVSEVAKAGYKAIIAGIQKFVGMVQNFFMKLSISGKGLHKEFVEFEKTHLTSLKGGEITSGALISRLGLVQGGGDVGRQFDTFINYCQNNMVRTIAGPVLTIIDRVMTELNNKSSGSSNISNAGIDAIISKMYPEQADQEDLRGSTVGSDWAIGSTPALLGGMRAWVASNHNVQTNENIPIVIEAGINRDVETERPESVTAADSNAARANIRAIVSILKYWEQIDMVSRLGRITSIIQRMNSDKQSGFSSAMDAALNPDRANLKTTLANSATILRAFAGQNTVSLIRHMLHVFGIYMAYLKASVSVGKASGEAASTEVATA